MDPLEQDQLDIFHRLLADEELADVAGLLQRKGVTESDIEVALGTLNERGGKLGAVWVVLMLALTPESPDVPGPRYSARATVQVIENPLLNLGDGGTGKSAESIATRIRRVLHHFANGTGGTFVFASQEPITVAAGISYGVTFGRMGGDAALPKVTRPVISIVDGVATITCSTAGAAITTSVDGGYPATPYAAPFAVASGVTIRAAASLAGRQQSDIATATAA